MGYSYAPSVGARARTGVERATLVRRTYGLVFLGVLVTMAGTAFGLTQPALEGEVIAHPFIMILCVMAPLFIVMRNPRAFPSNVALTLLFTFVEGLYISPFIAMAGGAAVQEAAFLTLTTFGALSVYVSVSRRDFSALGSFFMVGLVVLFVAMILNFFVQSAGVSLWIAAMMVFVFAGLLVFDTWRILRSGAYGPDDYVPAAVNIYLDLLNIFIAILSLVSGGNRGRR